MQHRFATAMLSVCVLFAAPAFAAVIYDNLTPNNMMAMATRPGGGSVFEIESADDFNLTTTTRIDAAHFVGLLVPNSAVTPTITQVVLEIYRIFIVVGGSKADQVRNRSLGTIENGVQEAVIDCNVSKRR